MTRRRAAGGRWAAFGVALGLVFALGACTPQRGAQRAPEPSASPTCTATWCLVVREDFSKAAPLGDFKQVYGSDLSGYPSGHSDTSGKGRYVPERVLSAHDGVLDWWVHSENGQPMTAAPLPQGYTGQRYGRWSVRFRADRAEGYKLAFLLWSVNDAWSDGEIDFPEGELGRSIYGFSHNTQGSPQHNQFKFDPKVAMSKWHVAEIEWTPEHLRFRLDGKISKTTSDAKALPQVKMRWVLQVETSLEGPAPDSKTEGHVQVDWIRVERYNALTH